MRVVAFVISSLVFGMGCINSSIKSWDWKTPKIDSAGSSISTIGFKYKEVHSDTFETVDFCFVDTNNSWRISKYDNQYYIDHLTNNFKKCESQRIDQWGRLMLISSMRTPLILTKNEILYAENYSDEWRPLNLGSKLNESIINITPTCSKKGEILYFIVNDQTIVSIDKELKVQKIPYPNHSDRLLKIAARDDTIVVLTSNSKICYSFDKGKKWDSTSSVPVKLTESDYMTYFLSFKENRTFFSKYNDYVDSTLSSDNFGKSWQPLIIINVNPSYKYDLGDYLIVTNVLDNLFLYSMNGGKDWHSVSRKSSLGNGFYSAANSSMMFFIKDLYEYPLNGSMIYKLDAKNINDFRRIVRYKTVDYKDTIKVDIELDKYGEPGSKNTLKVLGADTFNFNKIAGLEVLLDTTIDIGNSKNMSIYFPISKINANRFIPYKLRVELTDDLVDNVYVLGPISYNPSNFFKDHPRLTIVLLIIGGYVSLLGLMLFLQAYWLFVIHSRLKVIRSLEDSLGYFGIVIKVIREITFIPLFVAHRRTLDAWINKHGGQLKAYFERQASVRSKREYIPLPVRSEDNNIAIIEKPSPDSLFGFFKGKVVCIQIIGVGGIGKTTFAVQIGRWLASSENIKYFGNHQWIPILIEQDTTDIITVLCRDISSVTKHIDEEFLKLLLRKRRLILIFDSLSERDETTQGYVEKIHGVVPVNAMLITSRRKLNVSNNDAITLYPLELAPDKLLYFISHALQAHQMDVLKSAKNQIQLANKLSNIFISRGKEIPVIPILIQLVIGQIAKMAMLEKYQGNIEKLLADIPDSIPEIFFEYLNRVNPEDKAPNALKNEDMRHAAEIIAQLSLGDNFIPQDIQRQKAENVLKGQGLLTEKMDPINRLIDNGILETRKYGGKQFLRFSLDPLSEYLAARRYAEENDKDADKWKNLYEKIKDKGENASGFLQALELVHEAYWEKFKWFPPVE